MSDTMKAVVFHGPLKVAVEDVPIPTIQEPTDVIIKVEYTALCGSELHVFRGHEASNPGVIMGHEFAGRIHSTGSSIKNFQTGDMVVCPFTISCGDCFYCVSRHSSRCEQSACFGYEPLNGGQAEYVRVPLADSTLVRAPEGVSGPALVLMADIFPTGYFAATNAFSQISEKAARESTVVLLGLGPVGLCALLNTLDFQPKNVIVVDGVESRLKLAEKLGEGKVEGWNFLTQRQELEARVKELTNGRGADVVVEVVGLSPALRLGFDLIRPWGVMSSVGVHNGEMPWSAAEGYGKNLRIQMGRCPVRSIFEPALASLKKKQDKLGFMAEKIMPLTQAVESYDLFNKMQVQKVIFKVDEQ